MMWSLPEFEVFSHIMGRQLSCHRSCVCTCILTLVNINVLYATSSHCVDGPTFTSGHNEEIVHVQLIPQIAWLWTQLVILEHR